MVRKRADELESTIEDALAPGHFVEYRASWDFVHGVEAVRGSIAPLIRRGEAARAVALLESFIAGCYEKSAEIRMAHGRKSSFMRGFERLDEGRSMNEPSLRDRARKRWAKGAGRRRRS